MADDRIFSEDYLEEDDSSPLQRSDYVDSIPEEPTQPEEETKIETPSVPEEPEAPKKTTRRKTTKKKVTPEEPKQDIDQALLAYMETDHFRNKLYLEPPQVVERIIERQVPIEKIVERLVQTLKIFTGIHITLTTLFIR